MNEPWSVRARALLALAGALWLTLGSAFALPLTAMAQGEWPRCANAPFRFPSGNWIWQSYIPGFHWGVDLVDRSREMTTTASGPVLPYYEGSTYLDSAALPAGISYPADTIPVYAPISGYLAAGVTYRSFPDSALLTATLDSVFTPQVPTRNIRIWFAHMASNDFSVSYITHPSGPINEGDLIGYQGNGGTNPVHLHFEIDDSTQDYSPVDPSSYLGAPVSTPTSPFNYYSISCYQSPVGGIEWPTYNAQVLDQAGITGFAIDPPSTSTTGIDQVKLYVDGFPGTGGTYLGAPIYGLARSDVAQQYGSQFLNSGFSFNWNLASVAPGRHSLQLYAHQTSRNQWLLMDVRYVEVQPYIVFNFFNFLPTLIR